MNVGMTRARRKLLLVGDSSTLCRHPFFVELLDYVKGVGGYRTAHEVAETILHWSNKCMTDNYSN
jgi:superfamily I DNA and/or RNA helicase